MHLPRSFRDIPPLLQPTVPPPAELELRDALAIRRAFNLPGWEDPYMNDIVRAFRMASGKRRYVEIGSRDKGNVAWLARHILSDYANIVEVDMEEFKDQETKLRNSLKSGQTCHTLTGDCLSDGILGGVYDALNGEKADIIFCDTLHTFQHTLTEFDAYFDLVADGGILMFHDCYYEGGNEGIKGKAQALAQIDRFHPVHVVFANEPTHRFLPRETNLSVWGGCAMIVKI